MKEQQGITPPPRETLMLWCIVTEIDKYMEAQQHLKWKGRGLPAVCGLRGQNVRKEHLSQLPEVEELISATAKGNVKVWTIFLQGSLLKIFCVLHYRGKAGDQRDVRFGLLKPVKSVRCVRAVPFCLALLIISMCFMETFRSFRVMSDATSTCKRRKREIVMDKITHIVQHPKNWTPHRLARHLLRSADQHSGEKAQSHPQLVHKRLIICDVSEKKLSSHSCCHI